MITLLACASATAQTAYPNAPKGDTVDDYFGTQVADPYRWLENDTSAATARWVAEENALTQSYLSKIPFRDKLKARLKQVSDYEKIGCPFKKHGRYYIYRNNGLQNQSVLYTMDTPDGEQKVFLDPNRLSSDGTVALTGVTFSHDGRYAAYTISRSGSDWNEIYVIDIATRQLLPDHILWAKFTSAEWCGDGFYYSAYDAPEQGKEYSNMNEGHKIYYHKIGTTQDQDVLFYQNPAHPQRFYGVSVNDEETLMFLSESGEGAGNDLYVRDLRQPGSQFQQMTDDMSKTYLPVEVVGDTIFLMTNHGASRWQVMRTTLAKPGIRDWQTFIPESGNVLSSISMIGGRFVLTYMIDAAEHAFVYSKDGRQLHEVTLPSVGAVTFSGEKGSDECFYLFKSFTVPGTIYRYDLNSDRSQLYAQPKVNFRLADYESKQLFFESKDGTRIPMTITYKKGMRKNGKNPVYLYGYGGFNISLNPSFSAMTIPFLERGGIFAQVNLRGGGEYGEDWHVAGTKMQKQNVFDDFIGAAEYLIKTGYTSSERIAIVGGSNGGLLVGACMTQRPELFKVAVPRVGVMDMLRYHKFTVGWNWAPDYGTSADSPEMFRYLYGYSPLHNLKPGVSYPATLVTTADHDDRVVPAHSFKFAATLQACHAGSAPVLIRIDSKAGHGKGKPMAKVIEEMADVYGFIMYNLGMKY